MRIGILTSGGDCPGINATIRGVCKTAINYYGMEVIGIHSGFQGLLTKDVESFTDKSLSGLLNLGGTMLGTSREKPFKKGGVVSDVDKPALILRNIREMGLDCIVCIGGNGTQKTAAKFAAMGVNIVSVPKTIDNDIWGTDISFGFDSAVSIATDAIDRLHSTASSHKRVMVIEVMGHKAGWIALYSGMAGGGDVILVPEIPYSIKNIGNTILERLKKENLILSWWWPKGFRQTVVSVPQSISLKRLSMRQVSKPVKRYWGIFSVVVHLLLSTVISLRGWVVMQQN